MLKSLQKPTTRLPYYYGLRPQNRVSGGRYLNGSAARSGRTAHRGGQGFLYARHVYAIRHQYPSAARARTPRCLAGQHRTANNAGKNTGLGLENQAAGCDFGAVAAARHRPAVAQTQKLPPAASQTTDQKGKAAFSDRKTGLYLVIGEKTQIGDAVYTCSPSLLSIPEENPETGGWDYTVTMQPKNTVTPVQPDKKTDRSDQKAG